MNKTISAKQVLKKHLTILLVLTTLFSVGALSAISVSAEIRTPDDIPSHSVGIVGSFNDWKNDILMADDDNDGVYEGIVDIPQVTEEMITDWVINDTSTGKKYLQFKVRLDGEWENHWGYYQSLYWCVWGSQAGIPVQEAAVGHPLKFKVFLDTKQLDPMYLADPQETLEELSPLDYALELYVYYEIIEYEPSDSDSKNDITVPDTTDNNTMAWFAVFAAVSSAVTAVFFVKHKKSA